MLSVQKQVSKDLLAMEQMIRSSFKVVNEEFEDHLDAINENTQEIENQYESLCELNRKLEKLNERIDQISSMVKELVNERGSISLTLDEQRIFFVLYMHDDGFISFDDIAGRTHFNPDYARELITAMLDKGIKLTREIRDGKLHLKLNPYFKARQIRESIVKIDPAVVRQMENKVLGSFF